MSGGAGALRLCAAALSVGLGVAWVAVGLGKILPAGHAADGSWASQFPAWLVLAAAVGECVVGVMLLTGTRRAGAAGGVVLLLAFSVVLLIRPPAPGQSCGCAGALPVPGMVEAADPLLRNALASALHVLLLALCWPIRTSRPCV